MQPCEALEAVLRIFVVGICFTQVVADVAVETFEAQKAFKLL